MDTDCLDSVSMMSGEMSVLLLSQSAEARLRKECAAMLIKDLSDSTRNFLSKALDPETDACTDKEFLTMNWRGLAELMNFDAQDIENFEAHHPNMTKTKKILKQFQTNSGATVGVLWDFILRLQRFDILDGDQFRNKLEEDYKNLNKRRQKDSEREAELRRISEQSNPVQVPKVTSNFEEPVDYGKLDAEADEFHQMVVDDVNTNEKTMFDAFVSFCHDDMSFIQEMIRMVEKIHQLKLCINARDLLPGASTHFVTARLIAERCRKVILVMSPSFLRSPECEFQVKVALSLSPGAKRKILIPILFRHCRMPLVLQHVCLVDYTKSDLAEWFWGRLAASLKESRGEKVLIPKEDLASLSNMEYDITKDYKTSDQADINSVAKYNMDMTARIYDDSILQSENSHGPMQHTECYTSGGQGSGKRSPFSVEYGNNRRYPSDEEQTQEIDSRRVVHDQTSPRLLRSPTGGRLINPPEFSQQGMRDVGRKSVTHADVHYQRSSSFQQQQQQQGGNNGIPSSQRLLRSPPMQHTRSQKSNSTRGGDMLYGRHASATRGRPSPSPREVQSPPWTGIPESGLLPNPEEDHFQEEDDETLISVEYGNNPLGPRYNPHYEFEQSKEYPSFGKLLSRSQDYDLQSLDHNDVNINLERSISSLSSGYDDYRYHDNSEIVSRGPMYDRALQSTSSISSVAEEQDDPPGHFSLTSEPMNPISTPEHTGQVKQKKQSSGIHRFFPKKGTRKPKNQYNNN